MGNGFGEPGIHYFKCDRLQAAISLESYRDIKQYLIGIDQPVIIFLIQRRLVF